MAIKKIRKRDGRLVKFESGKIADAIYKATIAVKKKNRKLSEELATKVVKILEKRFIDKIPSVEDVQDLVEKILIQEGYSDIAKAYILYRKRREEIRKTKAVYGIYDEL